MTALNVNVVSSSYPWCVESPYPLVEGDTVNFSFNLAYASLVSASGPTCLIYRDEKDVSTTCLTGTCTATGTDNNILSKITALLKPGEYVLSVYGTIDGLVRCGGKLLLQVQAKGKTQ